MNLRMVKCIHVILTVIAEFQYYSSVGLWITFHSVGCATGFSKLNTKPCYVLGNVFERAKRY